MSKTPNLFRNLPWRCSLDASWTPLHKITAKVISLKNISNPHHGREMLKICSCKRIANLHSMANGEFPNFDTGIYTGCKFLARRDLKQKQKRRENLPERNFMACNVLEGRWPQRNTCWTRSKRYQNIERGWWKNNSRKHCLTSIIASILVPEVNYPNQQKNKQHVNVYWSKKTYVLNAISQSELTTPPPPSFPYRNR